MSSVRVKAYLCERDEKAQLSRLPQHADTLLQMRGVYCDLEGRELNLSDILKIKQDKSWGFYRVCPEALPGFPYLGTGRTLDAALADLYAKILMDRYWCSETRKLIEKAQYSWN